MVTNYKESNAQDTGPRQLESCTHPLGLFGVKPVHMSVCGALDRKIRTKWSNETKAFEINVRFLGIQHLKGVGDMVAARYHLKKFLLPVSQRRVYQSVMTCERVVVRRTGRSGRPSYTQMQCNDQRGEIKIIREKATRHKKRKDRI